MKRILLISMILLGSFLFFNSANAQGRWDGRFRHEERAHYSYGHGFWHPSIFGGYRDRFYFHHRRRCW